MGGDGSLRFQRSLPTKRMAAGSLLRDAAGRILLVEPVYKQDREIPGGAVEADESPLTCVAREVREELGISLQPGGLLVVEYQSSQQDRTESVMFVFDGGIVDDHVTERIRLPPDELRSWSFVEEHELDALVVPRLARRLRAALRALDDAAVSSRPLAPLYLEDGHIVG